MTTSVAEILVDRSLDEVWGVVTDVTSWKSWWNRDLTSVVPRWQIGATVTLATGERMTLFAFSKRERIGLRDIHGEKRIWVFRRAAREQTLVRMLHDPVSNDPNEAGAHAAREAQERTLVQLKNWVESRRPLATREGPAAHIETKAPASESSGEEARNMRRADDERSGIEHSASASNGRLFIPALLLAVCAASWSTFQCYQLVSEKQALAHLYTNQDQPLDDSTKLRNALDTIARDTALLATAGNANAQSIVDELARRGVTIDPTKAPGVPRKSDN